MMTRRYLPAWLLALLCLTLTSCSTYVNIPAQTGDVAQNNPNVTDVVTVQAVALRAVYDDRPPPGKFQVVLPTGSTPQTYQRVIAALGDQATWTHPGTKTDIDVTDGDKQPTDADARAALQKLPTLAVRQVLIRGWYATVDIARPVNLAQPESPAELVTANLRWFFFDGWYVQGPVRVWRIPVEDALKRSRAETEQAAPSKRGEP